jgi:hypothetical protein
MNRTLAMAAGGLGVVGLGVGTVFGIITMGHASTIDDNCRDHRCNAEGKDAADASQTSGLMSTVGFAVAGGALALAAVLWFTAPKVSSRASLERPFVVTW